MKLVFDVGMFDGSDTNYYLNEGFRVISVEANPELVEIATNIFSSQIESGNLHIVNAALAAPGESHAILTLSGTDLGSSTIISKKIASKIPYKTYEIPCININQLFDKYGIPYYLKVDIEGADRFCILNLSNRNKPSYVSFEAGEDIEELVEHMNSIGYRNYKLINQCYFEEFNNSRKPLRRAKREIARKIFKILGYKDPLYRSFNNKFFKLRHSSGPAPWESDGDWYSASELLKTWGKAREFVDKYGTWFDVHVTS